ncbi:hypothetical protein ABW19_dt0207820 [Dactylella cylindrospora]|nr:hypothetical protein ABW19_dt0207820 [Dactylella cylindrospora]
MSGSRSAMPPRQPSTGSAPRRDMMFCHECQNEWFRDEHGLQCPNPRCRSEFTEILENETSDPRAERFDPFDDFDELEDEEEDHFDNDHHRHHHQHHQSPNPHGFTLRMGGDHGPSISFRTVRGEFGPGGSPFGGGHVIGGLSPNPRDPFNSPFDPPSPGRPHGTSPGPEQPRRTPAATPNWGNAGSPIAEMFTSIIQNIVGSNGAQRGGQQRDGARFPGEQQPGGPGSSPPGGLGGPGGPGGLGGPGGPGQSPHGGSPMPPGQGDNPFVMRFPRSGGGVTYYSSTRTWTGPNGEVRTVRTSSPMPNGPANGPDAALDIADILANMFGAGTQNQNGQGGIPPFFQAFGLGHGPSGDYAWSQQDMDRILSQLMEQHQGNAPPPASEDSIKNLPKAKVSQAEVDEGSECVVCQDEFKVDEEVVKLPCKHIYHEECVKRWLESHDACPICRTPITPESERRQRPAPGGPSGSGPHQHQAGGNGSGSGSHTASGSGGGNGARWTWSASYGLP